MNIRVSDTVKAELEGAPKGFYLLGHRDARHAAAELVAASEAQERAVSVPDGCREAIAIACEGFNMSADLRKHLESALWAAPPAAPQAPELTNAQIIAAVEEFSSGQSMSANYIFRRARVIEMVRHLTAPHGESDKTAGSV